MDVRLLADTIVRQTTVLLAQVATAAGVRAPLAHVANQVFLDLARELEGQGVRRKVVADMFGLALRSYEMKMRRVLAASEVQRSDWRNLYAKLEERSLTRLQLEKSFRHLSSRDLSALLNDLVDSGLVYRSGSGVSALYGITPEADRLNGETENQIETLANLLWLVLATQGDQGRAELERPLQVSPEVFTRALDALLDSGRVKTHQEGDQTLYAAESFFIPVGAEQGWEAAVCDHYGAVATAIANKINSPQSRADDTVGGSTHRFSVYPGHPLRDEVQNLLRRTRAQVDDLWQRVHDYNQQHPVPEEAEKITFYYGQSTTRVE